MKTYHLQLQRGLALPIMLIMLVVLLVGSIYMMKASTTSTMTTANLAYDSALSKAVDLGLLRGAAWLNTTAAGANRNILFDDSTANGYVATVDPAHTVADAAFWSGSVMLDDTAGNKIEYVIHRLCAAKGAYDASGPPPNTCVVTTPNTSATGSGVAEGESLAGDTVEFAEPPQVHYVVTARIYGPRGGNVINQVVVMIGA